MKNFLAIVFTWLSLCCAVNAQVPGGGAMVPSVGICCKNAIGSSQGTITAGQTMFATPNTFGANQNFASISPSNGTFRNLYFRTAASPGAGQTYIITLYVGTVAAMSATSLTCTISGASATTCSDTADTAAVLAGQSWAIQIVVSGAAASTAQWQSGIELDAF